MVDMFKASLDTSGWSDAFAVLNGPLKESLARRMCVEGGVLMRDEAKSQVARSQGPYTESSRGSHESGTLENSIYLVFDQAASSDTLFTYSVSWNAKQAWWGKLVEFGWIQTHKVYMGKDGTWYTTKTELAAPKHHAAHPFLRPAYDISFPQLAAVMTARGKRELPILLGSMGQ